MCENLRVEDTIARVRVQLNTEKVKLWLAPYYTDACGPSEEDLETLAKDFSAKLSLPLQKCLCALSELQSNALDKLKTRKQFQETGLATLKIKNANGILTVQLPLSATGQNLFEMVAEKMSLPIDRIKLIANGNLISATVALSEQGLTNGLKLLAIVLEQSREETQEQESVQQKLKRTKDDVKLLMAKDQMFMHMEDQNGNAVHLPPEERQSIMMALAIHEKGKAALKRQQFNEALYLFLEADQEFAHCTSQLLATVDNYALLYLDIVWCYIKLRSADQLMDAERRLKQCETRMLASYGPDCSRVKAIKGSACGERCLLLRLHLMQAIVMYHQNRLDEARGAFGAVAMELARLKIDDGALNQLIEMGFTVNEARMALREENGNTTDAVANIYAKREKRKKARRRGKVERELAHECNNKEDWINPRSLASLTEMGFDISLAKVALKASQNDVNQALVLLSDVPSLLSAHPDAMVPSTSHNDKQEDQLMTKILKMGAIADDFAAKLFVGLKKKAADEIETILAQISNYEGPRDEIITVILESLGVNDSFNSSTSSASSPNKQELEEATQKAKQFATEFEAYDRFSEDINYADDDYLDFPLDDEEKLLLEYKSVLAI